MQAYEKATNTHDFANLQPLIAPNATYWFTDGSFNGIDEIRQAIEATFQKIQDETYEIANLEWVAKDSNVAVCRYTFAWSGVIDGTRQSGTGRGTNVLTQQDSTWRVQHEHLSR